MFYIYAFAYMSMMFAFLVILGTSLYWLDRWLDTDANDGVGAKHRATT